MSSTVVILPKSKPSVWTLKDDDRAPSYNFRTVSYFSKPKLFVEDVSKKPSEEMKSLISDRAISDLSKAAKRAVLHQYASVKQHSSHRRLIKTSESYRKQMRRTKSFDTPRLEVYSAPPIMANASFHDNSQTTVMPPKIVINSASQKSLLLNDRRIENVKSQTRIQSDAGSRTGFTEKDKKLSEQSMLDFTPRSTMSNDSSSFLGAYSPDSQTSVYSPKTPLYSARSHRSFTDWDWVRERLASRETTMERPDSCLTFNDFLETLSLKSEEYDTDLEDNFPNQNIQSTDRTGVCRYKEVCVNKGITLAKQVVRKLSKENQAFALSHRSLNKGDAEALATALSNNSIVQSVSLSGNHIDDEAAKPIFSMLRKNSHIKKLDLSNNKLMNDKHNYMSRVLSENSTLTHVTLSRNKLGNKEALLLSEALRSNYSMEYLNLSHNCFSDLGGQSFAAALIDNDFLTSLDLSWNVLGRKAASALGKALKANHCLQSLDVSYNGFGDDGTAAFGRSLRHNSTLRFLSLAVNHIGSFGSEKLAFGICGSPKKGKKSKSKIKSLNLSRNPLGRKGILMLLKHIEQHDTLYDLVIDEVILTSDALSLLKRLSTSSNAVLFHEGQDDQDRKASAIRLGARCLTDMLGNQFKPSEFLASIDPDDKGVAIDRLKNYLEKLDPAPSELELQRLVSCLYTKRTNLLHYRDIFNASTQPRVSFKPTVTKIRKKPRS